MTKLENARFWQILAVVWCLVALGRFVDMADKGYEIKRLASALMYAVLAVGYFIIGKRDAKKARLDDGHRQVNPPPAAGLEKEDR